MGQGGFPKPRGAKDQRVVEGFAPTLSRRDKDLKLLLYRRLTHVLGQAYGTQGAIKSLLLRGRIGGDDAILLNHERSPAPGVLKSRS